VKLELAKTADVKEISKLLNLAYRGTGGWTTESALVKGARSSENAVAIDIQTPNTFVLVSRIKNNIKACISVTENENRVYIGSFAVHPELQNLGYGKIVLNLAEQYAIAHFKPVQFIMTVLSSRKELIEYYLRRGYERNGITEEYPIHLNVGVPINPNLTIEELTKNV
tara:strand:+ start:20717 stop:21220 length:504 start_codon:yes stop_codon:yes gene_type:complete